jgi:hypothetical protein
MLEKQARAPRPLSELLVEQILAFKTSGRFASA